MVTAESGPKCSGPADMRRKSSRSPLLLMNVNAAWFFLSHRAPVARAALAAGYCVHVAAGVTQSYEAKAVGALGVELHPVPVSRSGLNPLNEGDYFVALLRLMRKLKPSIVHNVTAKPIIFGTAATAMLGRIPTVNAVSGLGYAFSGGDDRRWLATPMIAAYRAALRARHSVCIVQNDDDRALVGLREEDAGKSWVRIAGSGVDLDQFAMDQEPPGPLCVVFPARLLRDKGLMEFAEAARLVRARNPQVRFLLVGALDPQNPAAVSAAEVEQLVSRGHVEWPGYSGDMPAVFRHCHIVCLPSYREGLPKALIEACAAGRPIVTTDVPGCRDVVADGRNGLLVPPRNAVALADAIERLLHDPALRRSMGEQGRNRAEAEFSLQSVVAQTLDIYRRLQ